MLAWIFHFHTSSFLGNWTTRGYSKKSVPSCNPQRTTTATALEEKIKSRTARVGIIGLGYVGLPLAMEFAKAGFRLLESTSSQPRSRS